MLVKVEKINEYIFQLLGLKSEIIVFKRLRVARFEDSS